MMIPGAKSIDLPSVERSARRFMCGVASVAAIIGLAFHAGLLSMAPQYDRQSWYLVSEHAGLVVTTVVVDEAACRKREDGAAVCRSGATMQSGAGGAVR